MTDRLICFVEDVTVHCIQRRMPPGLSLTEIPRPQRAAEMPERFQRTLAPRADIDLLPSDVEEAQWKT